MKLIQIERSGSTQGTYWQTPVQPVATLEQLAAEDDIISITERPDLSNYVQGHAQCRVIQVRSGGVYTGTLGRFFILEPEMPIGYPADWPRCPACGEPAMDGHITCGKASCAEGSWR